ncbi:MAG: class I SAM-dependent methyltransferase [Oscillospiraceae bacterium]|nr:class I SAM-dependent methyltransferase [Oscillospiraceae bacterium]
MERSDVINFFDTLAPSWDAEMIHSDGIINVILDCGGVSAGKRVLDVACGTGVLFPDYLDRSVKCVVGVDISPEMAKIAAEKHDDARVKVICADVQELEFDEKFDCVMIYNAFPHFPEPSKLLAYLARYLVPGGRLTVAHGMSRAKIDAHHHDSASKVSVGLMHEIELASLMGQWFTVDTVISDAEKYIVSGVVR